MRYLYELHPIVNALALALIVAGFLAAVAWLLQAPRKMRGRELEVEDRGQLEAAEEEVRDLNAFTSPDDADDELQDWGPGAPR